MELRASDADREQAVERLRTAAMEGRLDSEELEQRVQTAYAARFCTELSALTADVTPPPATVPPSPVPVRPTFVAPTPSTNGFAIASIVCSVIWFGWLGSFLAVIFGHVALRQIRETGGVQRGRSLAIGGLVIGYFAIVSVIAVFLVMFLGM
jgi:Domain of unknown function (DUF1707)/Domain of unknown function (DUF4190)